MENIKNDQQPTQSPMSLGERVYTRLSLLDQATVMYHAEGMEFIELLDYFINCPPDAKRYVWSGPRYLILGEELDTEDPHNPRSKKIDPYWHIAWQHCLDGFGPTLFKIAPYKLDKVMFMRNKNGHQSKFKLYSWDRLKKFFT